MLFNAFRRNFLACSHQNYQIAHKEPILCYLTLFVEIFLLLVCTKMTKITKVHFVRSKFRGKLSPDVNEIRLSPQVQTIARHHPWKFFYYWTCITKDATKERRYRTRARLISSANVGTRHNRRSASPVSRLRKHATKQTENSDCE